MVLEKFKLHSVIVGSGTGFILQPSACEYTYIVTARHLFYDESKEGRGDEQVEKRDGEIINITRFIKLAEELETNFIEFSIEKNKNYFPHDVADIALLKIEYLPDLLCVNIQEDFQDVEKFLICGFPDKLRHSKKCGERYTSHEIERFISDNDTNCRAQLSNMTLGYSDIIGMSGCGILRNDGSNVSLIGIQSKVPTQNSNGQIDFVPIKFLLEIISKNKLLPLFIEDVDDFSEINKDWELRNNIFSVTYNSESKPYYSARNIDETFKNYLQSDKNIWISGVSGVGKTFLIIGNLSNTTENPIRIDLTCSQLECIDDYFEYINNEIIEQCSLQKMSSKANVYEKISDNLCEINIHSNEILIFVDEVPILDKDRFYNFLIGFINISERYSNLISNRKKIKWIISTRISPKEHLNNRDNCLSNTQKANKNFNFKNLEVWNEEELASLIDLLKGSLNFKISKENQEKIIKLSKGLPGVLKSVFERLLLEGCTIEEAIEMIKQENI